MTRDEATESLPHWERFCEAVQQAHPEWVPYLLGAVAGYGIYDTDDVRYFLEFPSPDPTIPEPLIVEVTSAGSSIDVHWFRFFQHVFLGRFGIEAQFMNVISTVEEWLDPNLAFDYDRDYPIHFVPFSLKPLSEMKPTQL